MPPDLSQLQIIAGIALTAVTVMGVVFGWFGKLWVGLKHVFMRKESSALLEVPSKTLVVLPLSAAGACWWHMGSSGGEPAMQIVAEFKCTNISVYDALITGAQLRKPRSFGMVLTQSQGESIYGSYPIPTRATSQVSVSLWVVPPVCKPGTPFKADVALRDQFGNLHWARDVEFIYR
ncbi:hypothetical protein [Dokdonella sp.]|uniref:hypothetical protein n=1 Tax=Dokdonella sp. TaxID=2291710 RepID=UPI003529C2F3